MSYTRIPELTTKEESRIRDLIIKEKQKYLDSPTYVQVDRDEEIHELDHKRLHSDWWNELTGDLVHYGRGKLEPENYYFLLKAWLDVILCERLNECESPDEELEDIFDEMDEEPLEIALVVLPKLLKDYAIPNTRKLGDLKAEYQEELREYVNSLPVTRVKVALSDWLEYFQRKGMARLGIEIAAKAIPIQFVLDRLENCEDTLGMDWSDLGLSKDATYAEAVAVARKKLE